MQNAWKEAARILRRRCEAMQTQLDWIREGDAAMRDEKFDEPFDEWEMAARHWHAKMREAERERDEMRHLLARCVRYAFERVYFEREELRRELVDVSAERDRWSKRVIHLEAKLDKLRELLK